MKVTFLILSLSFIQVRINCQNFIGSNSGIIISSKTACIYDHPKEYVPTCPKNHTDHIIPVVYGKPTAKTIKRAEKVEVYLGGCMFIPCHPKFYCKIHKEKF